MTKVGITKLTTIANRARAECILMMGRAGGGHVGGAMSAIETLVHLYFQEMNITKDNLSSSERDRFILSKGHAGPGLYAVLHAKGFIPDEWLTTLNKQGTRLPSHCNMSLTPGVDFTTGSLGQGFSVAAGMALANKIKGSPHRTFVMIGDGETQEGQIWETALFAAHHRLSNLVAFTDNNKLQLDGVTAEILEVEDLKAKWESFGWHTQRINGHDFNAIATAMADAKEAVDAPSMIILETQKSRGFSPGENSTKNHHMAFDNAVAEAESKKLAIH